MCCGCENEDVCESIVDVKMKRYVNSCVVDVKMKRSVSVLWM